MNHDIWQITKKILGVVLIVGGIAGLFLPFLQGIAMIVAGAALLECKRLSNFVRRILAKFKQ